MGMQVLPESWEQTSSAIAQDTSGNFLVCEADAGISYYNVQTSGFRYFGVGDRFYAFSGDGGRRNLLDI